MMRRFLTIAAILLCAGCSSSQPAAGGGRHAGTIPDTLRIAMSPNVNTLNPILSTQQTETFAQTFIFDPLIATDPDGHDVPMLAISVPTTDNAGISGDGLRITYHLRRGVKWQDGAPFTSRDVAFSVAAIMNPNNTVSSRHGYDDIARVLTPDAYTAVFVLKHPFAPAVHTFFAHSDAPFMILPAHLLAGYKSLDRVPFNSAPVGTGPYRVTRWLRGDRIEYTAFDGYYRGKPGLRAISLRIVPDENTIVNQMKSHEIDYFVQASPRTYPQLKALPDVSVRLVPFNGSDSLMLNTVKPPLDDVRVRRALGLAIDKQRLVDTVTFGTAIAATEDLPSFLWAYDPTAGTTKHDLPAAEALLDAAGWKAGADGMRSRNGVKLTLGIASRSDSATDRERSVLIASMLHTAGIDTTQHGYTTGVLYGPAAANGILASGNYDIGLLTWYAGVDPDDSSQLLCSERPPNGYDWSRYCTPKMDAEQRIALTKYDRATRGKAYAQIEQMLAADAPYIYLWWPRQIEAVNVDLKNYKPNGIVESWNSWEWTI